MDTITLRLWLGRNGKAPFEIWFNALDRGARVKVSAALFRMEEGNFSDSKFLANGVWERRIHSGPGYRIYFAKETECLIVLLGGGSKRTQVKDIRQAQLLWANRRAQLSDV